MYELPSRSRTKRATFKILSRSESSSVEDLSHVTRYHLPLDSISVYIRDFLSDIARKGKKKRFASREHGKCPALRGINPRVTDFDIIFHGAYTS